MRTRIDRLREYYDNTDTSDMLERATLEVPEPPVEPMVTREATGQQPPADPASRPITT